MKPRDVKRVAYALGPSSSIGGVALWAHATYGEQAAVAPGLLGVAAGLLAHKTGEATAWGVTGASGLATVVAYCGWDTPSLIGWLVGVGTSLSARLWFEHKDKHAEIDKQIRRVRLETALANRDVARRRLAGDVDVDLSGNTPEETALRQAFYSVYRKQLLGVTIEPSRLGYKATVSLPPELERAKVLREWSKIEGALATEGRYTPEGGGVSNQLVVHYRERDGLGATIEYVPVAYENVEEPVYLGTDENDLSTFLQLLGKHALILGTSGNGKSNLVNLLILGLVRAGAAVIGIDMKRGVELASVKPLLVTLADTDEKAREVFDWLESELDRRSEIMKREGARVWTEEMGPFVWIFTDELSELTSKRYKVEGLPDLPDLLESGLRICRAFGVHFVSSTQAPSRRCFGGSTDARVNYKIRISTRLEEAAHAQFAFGPSWKARGWDPNGKLEGPGEFLLSSEAHTKPIRRKAPYVTDADLASEVERLLPYRVGLDGSPWGEGGVALTIETRVLNLLRHRSDLSRQDIEQALGLDDSQVKNAISKLRRRRGVEIEYDSGVGVYRLAGGRVPIEDILE